MYNLKFNSLLLLLFYYLLSLLKRKLKFLILISFQKFFLFLSLSRFLNTSMIEYSIFREGEIYRSFSLRTEIQYSFSSNIPMSPSTYFKPVL